MPDLEGLYSAFLCDTLSIISDPLIATSCPYAEGATGNVATEDVLYMLDGLGIETGVDMDKLVDAGRFISQVIQRPIASRAANAVLAKRERTTLQTQ